MDSARQLREASSGNWQNCYDQGWQGLIVPEAFAHPAKFARGLVERIYDYLLSTGRLVRGNTVVDPFGGVALGGIIGASKGLRWVGCELEPRFVALAEQNIAMHRRTWEAAGDPLPRIVQGDSRGLSDVLGPVLAEAVVSSPPFAKQMNDGGDTPAARGIGRNGREQRPCEARGEHNLTRNYGDSPGQLQQMPPGDVAAVLSSPPYAETAVAKNSNGVDLRKQFETYQAAGGGASFEAFCATQRRHSGDYGSAPGQLGAMPAGSVDGVLSSPPYAETALQHGADYWQKKFAKNPEIAAEMIRRGAGKPGNNCTGGPDAYGVSDGQLAALPAGTVDGVVSSPPYEEGLGHGGTKQLPILVEKKLHSALANNGYGGGPGNISNLVGQTFWQASRLIVLQCRLLLKPRGTAVFVTKDFVRNKQRVPFSDDWRRLCEACGFRMVEWIKASLVKETVENQLFGGPTTRRKERKSFFRRLAEKKGSPRIDHEDVLVMEAI